MRFWCHVCCLFRHLSGCYTCETRHAQWPLSCYAIQTALFLWPRLMRCVRVCALLRAHFSSKWSENKNALWTESSNLSISPTVGTGCTPKAHGLLERMLAKGVRLARVCVLSRRRSAPCKLKRVICFFFLVFFDPSFMTGKQRKKVNVTKHGEGDCHSGVCQFIHKPNSILV